MKLYRSTHNSMASSKIFVPRHRRDTTGQNQREGLSAEKRFETLCQRNGWEVVQATRDENYKQHIDCWVNVSEDGKHVGCFSVDVKAAKRVARRDRRNQFTEVQDKLHWVEWTGRSGWPGWVRGKAKWMAFGMCDGSFLMVDRARLESEVEPMIASKRHISPNTQWDCTDGVLWKRRGNKDEMTMVSTPQLRDIPGTWTLRN